MTAEDKALAFDVLALALTNQWSNGQWSWFCHTPSGGQKCDTREEAVADLVAYGCREYRHLEKRGKAFAAMRQS